jgi:hypothetical protein
LRVDKEEEEEIEDHEKEAEENTKESLPEDRTKESGRGGGIHIRSDPIDAQEEVNHEDCHETEDHHKIAIDSEFHSGAKVMKDKTS